MLDLPLRPLAQNEELEWTGGEARGRGGLVKGALAMSVALPGGQDRIMIYGPKTDGTYIVEFRMADGESLAINIPAGETRVHDRDQTPGFLFTFDHAGSILSSSAAANMRCTAP
jgi:hypothetical protein